MKARLNAGSRVLETPQVMQHYGPKAALFAIAIQLGDAAPDGDCGPSARRP
jgi:hypothetical protein